MALLRQLFPRTNTALCNMLSEQAGLCFVFCMNYNYYFDSQDENDNPPEFSKPSYIVKIPENINAGKSQDLKISDHRNIV